MKAPSPYESAQTDSAVFVQSKPKKPKSNNQTKIRFMRARVKLGLSPNSTGLLDWSKMNKRTSFIWKFETLRETATWVIQSARRDFKRHPLVDRSQIALHYIQHGFGIMPSDILGEQRNQVLIIPRYIGMLLVNRAGISAKETARRFRRDHTSLALAEEKVGHLFEGLPDVEENTGDERPASDGQSEGSISA